MALNAAASSGQRVEIPGLRTATSSTFAEADGTLTTDLAAVPVRQFNNGSWFDIDPTLHREAGAIEPAVLPVDLALGHVSVGDRPPTSRCTRLRVDLGRPRCLLLTFPRRRGRATGSPLAHR